MQPQSSPVSRSSRSNTSVSSKFDNYMTDDELEISDQSSQQHALQSYTGKSEQPVSPSAQSCMQYTQQSYSGHGHDQQPVHHSALSLSDASQWYAQQSYTAPHPIALSLSDASQCYAQQSYTALQSYAAPYPTALSLCPDASQCYAQQSYTAPYPNNTYDSQQYAEQPCTATAPYPYHAYAQVYKKQEMN